MKIKGRISILVGAESTRIEIKDDNANVRFLDIDLSPDQLSRCLSRQSEVPCELNIRGLEKIGKKHENSSFEFLKPEKLPIRYGTTKEEANKILYNAALQALKESNMEEWAPDNYFDAQGAFFRKNNEDWVRVTIRRYV